jgi:hypothetical protein
LHAFIGKNSDIPLVSLQSVQVGDVGMGFSFGVASIANLCARYSS